jgi:plasmid rolling circle replication initiator protein Rep
MTRVLMLKNRKNELAAMSKVLSKGLYPKNFIPLIEIVREKQLCKKIVDPETGELVAVSKSSSTKRIQYMMDYPDMECGATLSYIS